MKNKTYQTPINLLIEADIYQRIRMLAKQGKISMSKLIRDGIKLKIAEIDKENNSI